MTQQNRYRTPAYLKKKRKRLIIKISLICISLFIFLGCFVYLFNHQKLQIVAIEVSETQFVDPIEINNEVQKILRNKNFLIFKKTNFLFVPKKTISENLINNFLPVSQVSTRVDDKIIKIQVNEYNPVAKYCQEFKNEIPMCFLMNRDGLIFYQIDDRNMIRDDYSNLIEFGGLDFGNIPLGMYYLDLERFDTLYNFADSLEQINIKPISINTEDLETFIVKTEKGPDLLIESNDEDAETLLNNLKTTIEIEEINEIQFENLEYIDLRFGKNIYYKIK